MFVGEDPVCDTASAIIRPNILLDRDINAVFAVFGFVAAMPVTVGSTTVVTATASSMLVWSRVTKHRRLLMGSTEHPSTCIAMAWYVC